MKRIIDLRSDTVTKPSQKMREAMANAVVGDDVLGEDPTVNELEELSSRLTGKEAALFVPSGTFANQLAIMTHIKRGGEVYLSEDSHVVQHECGAAALLSGAFLRTIAPKGKFLTWDEIEPKIRKVDNIHFPDPALIEIENPLSNGGVMNLHEMKQIKEGAEKYHIPVHLDGARIFNAAQTLNVSIKEIATHTDSLMFCLSKGLTAPIGSVLCGTKDFISSARRNRKIMGGGMRQAGILAAAGIFALENMVDRLSQDHENAKKLAEAFNKQSGFHVLMDQIDINMVYMSVVGTEDIFAQEQFLDLLKSKNILTYPPENGYFRFVTSNEVTNEDMEYIISLIPELGKQWNSLME